MSRPLFTIAITACIMIASCGEKNRTPEGKMEKGTMEYFIKTLDLQATGKYNEILVEGKHRTDRVAPDVVRGFIEGIEITRFSLTQGAKFEDGKATLWWFISDFGAKGKPEEVLASIQDIFKTFGLMAQEPVEDEDGWKEYSFVKETDEMKWFIKMKELDRFIGSKEPMCGGDVICNITFREPIAQPAVGEMVESYPQIACPALPGEVLDYLKDKKVEHMSYGGTWEWYYTWGVTIPAGEETAAEKMLNDVAGIIGNLGFEVWKEEEGRVTYQRQGLVGETSSFMDLEIDDSRFELRFQPQS
jgi:hypothetical protein